MINDGGGGMWQQLAKDKAVVELAAEVKVGGAEDCPG